MHRLIARAPLRCAFSYAPLAIAMGAVLVVFPAPLRAQIVVKNPNASLTLEAWANAAGVVGAADARADNSPVQLDGAIRVLGVVNVAGFGRIGGRIVGEALAGADDDARFGERSALWIGKFGRLEYGNRMGLPDVLTGYAPNAFQFTSAEFGPASGLSLDPGGGIARRFAPDAIRNDLDSLALLGFGTSLFNDQSRKILYVSPKRGGFLGGVSYAAGVDGSTASDLIQAGLVHESYWNENEFRIGGVYTHVDSPQGTGVDSLYAGATLVVNNDWYFGLAATWNPNSPEAAIPGWRGDAFGITTSLNYNHGPWTVGGFLQDSRGREASNIAAERLRAGELGASYRISTKLRLFAAVYHYFFDSEAGDTPTQATRATQVIAGVRVTL